VPSVRGPGERLIEGALAALAKALSSTRTRWMRHDPTGIELEVSFAWISFELEALERCRPARFGARCAQLRSDRGTQGGWGSVSVTRWLARRKSD